MNKKIVLVAVAVVVIVVGYMAWKKPAPSASGDTYKIGFIAPLTGDAASFGTSQRAAVEVAAKEINDAGGVNGKQIEIIYEDGKCNGQAAANAGQKLINIDKVVVIIGGSCSGESSAVGPLAMQSKMILFSPWSSAPSLSKLGKYFFRDYPSDTYQGKVDAEYAYENLGARNVAILYHVSEWGTGIKTVFIQRFQELGGKIVIEEGLPQTATDYRTPLSKIKGLSADLVYSPMYPDGSIPALTQAKELGITKTFFGGDAWDDPKLHAAVSGKGTFLFTAPVIASPEDFKAKVLAITHGEQILSGTPNAYDALKIIAAAIAKVGTDPDKLADAIRATVYEGVSGHIAFDQNGDLTSASYVVKRIENGTAVEVK